MHCSKIGRYTQGAGGRIKQQRLWLVKPQFQFVISALSCGRCRCPEASYPEQFSGGSPGSGRSAGVRLNLRGVWLRAGLSLLLAVPGSIQPSVSPAGAGGQSQPQTQAGRQAEGAPAEGDEEDQSRHPGPAAQQGLRSAGAGRGCEQTSLWSCN